jgi:glutamyl-tRNA synthetase
MKFSSEYYENLEARIPAGKLRTRFAPSPTGYMHLGGLRTALYAYLLAKKNDGIFILRIEDTDQERLIEGAAEFIYDTLKSAGIFYDEGPDVGGPAGPYIQSERREIYEAYITLLMEKGHAYPCFCNKEILDEQRNIHRASRVPHKYDGRCSLLSHEEIAAKKAEGMPYVIRQRMKKEGTTFFDDLIFGRIEVDNSTLDDTVLVKSDGMPTYNFANVVDDHLMGITHIIRGNEFLSSTPKYILLYQSFGWKPPEFIHCSPIMRDAANKLSKRDGDAYFNDYVEKGYLVEAIINYIALLGWSPANEERKFSLAELEAIFDIRGISKDPSIFDAKNLKSLNGSYLRDMSDEAFYDAALPYIKKGVKRAVDTAYVAHILKERCDLLSEIPELLDFIDVLPDYPLDLFNNKKMKSDLGSAKEILGQVLSVLEKEEEWTQERVRHVMMQLAERSGNKSGQILWPLRVALTGKMFTPGGGIELSIILGKTESVRRIKKAIEMLQESKEKLPEDVSSVPEEKAPELSNQNHSISITKTDDANNARPFSSADAVKPVARPLTDPLEIERIADIAKLDVSKHVNELAGDYQQIFKKLDVLKQASVNIDEYPLNREKVNVFR